MADRPEPPFTPYVGPRETLAELTPLAVGLGVVLSLTFGMVNAYLGLKIGLTVSASIPSAVLSMAILRGLLRRGTVLENNVVHAIASTGESLAAGVIFTVPALIFLDLHPSVFDIFLIGVAAGVLGILLMIPFRHALTVEEHATLPFPEGTACAQVLMAGDRGGVTARPVVVGIVLGALYQFAMRGLTLWRDAVTVTAERLHKATFGMELSPLFLGVGFLVGPRIAGTMLGGGLLGGPCSCRGSTPSAAVLSGSRSASPISRVSPRPTSGADTSATSGRAPSRPGAFRRWCARCR